MPLNALFSAAPSDWDDYAAPLQEAFAAAALSVHLSRDIPAAEVDYIIYAPNDHLQDFASFTRCKAVLSLWAGVETIAPNTTLTQPLCRLVDTGLTQGMVEWVTGHVLRHHLGMDQQIKNQNRRTTRRIHTIIHHKIKHKKDDSHDAVEHSNEKVVDGMALLTTKCGQWKK